MSDTFARVRALLCKHYDLTSAAIHPETSLEDLGVDSISSIEFFWYVEDEFNVTVGLDDVRLSTIVEVVRHVDELIARRRRGEL